MVGLPVFCSSLTSKTRRHSQMAFFGVLQPLLDAARGLYIMYREVFPINSTNVSVNLNGWLNIFTDVVGTLRFGAMTHGKHALLSFLSSDSPWKTSKYWSHRSSIYSLFLPAMLVLHYVTVMTRMTMLKVIMPLNDGWRDLRNDAGRVGVPRHCQRSFRGPTLHAAP